jgi:hypothetical protein
MGPSVNATLDRICVDKLDKLKESVIEGLIPRPPVMLCKDCNLPSLSLPAAALQRIEILAVHWREWMRMQCMNVRKMTPSGRQLTAVDGVSMLCRLANDPSSNLTLLVSAQRSLLSATHSQCWQQW